MQAVLWDMDGTLVDTEPYWIATEYAMAEKYGATWSQAHALQLVGSDLIDSASPPNRSSRSCWTAWSP
jgi:beta-phosphoglucomutase-like phosphatase (HAD superfamily)